MSHAAERVEQRLLEAGWSYGQCDRLSEFAEQWAAKTDAFSEAVRLQVLPFLAGEDHESNGDEVWGMYRDQRLITVMLRRSTQPDSGLRVNKVTRLV